ncbi:MAG: tail fiber domain-containing protein, partial [Methylomonas sp.]|nr:tail fiber domain-containing protein [Methylomonas sp.]
RGVLDAIKKIPIESWRYKEGEGPDREVHVGPMAQDWNAATGLGDGKSIDAISAIGITMGAVKELAEKVESLDSGKKAARRLQPRSIMKKAA